MHSAISWQMHGEALELPRETLYYQVSLVSNQMRFQKKQLLGFSDRSKLVLRWLR